MKTIKPGIRQKPNGHYFATKSIDGKRYYKEFATLREAEVWKNKFHPLANKEPKALAYPAKSPASDLVNGVDKQITVREIYELYLNGPLKALGDYTQYKLPLRMNRFLPPILSLKAAELTPKVISALIEEAKKTADRTRGRCDYKEELKHLTAILNWYRKEHDFKFVIPVMDYHKHMSRVAERPSKRKGLRADELASFIGALEWPLSFLAAIEFIYAMRINESCALSVETVNLRTCEIRVRDSITWVKDVPRLKRSTKTGNDSTLRMTEWVHAGFSRLKDELPPGCKFFFHHKGGLPRYRPIVDAYNKALKEIGVVDVSGTHFIRHTAGAISRKFGGVDASQAILRHSSVRMSEHYASLEVDEIATNVVANAEKILLEGRASNASKNQQMITVSAS